MFRLFDRKELRNSDGDAFELEISNAIMPVIQKWEHNDFSILDMERIIVSLVTIKMALMRIKKGSRIK